MGPQDLYAQTFSGDDAPQAPAPGPRELYAQTFGEAPPQQTPIMPASVGDLGKELLNNTVRAGAKALWALPGMAMDAGVAVRNLIAGRGQNGTYPYELPSQTFTRALDSVTAAPSTTAGKVGEFVSSALMGSRLAPTYAPSALPGGGAVPTNFQAPQAPLTQAQQNLAQARQAGYVFPPSTVNPTILNKTIEAIGGKDATAQDAAVANMPTTMSAVRQSIGLGPTDEITPQVLAGIRKQAASAKADVVEKSGAAVNLDTPFSDAIAKITAPYRQAESELGPEFGNPGLVKAADAINKPQITPSVAMKAVQQLRDKADVAFRSGDGTTGRDYKALATNLEDAIDRHLSATGNQGTVDAYRAARALQARTYDIEDALNQATGNVNPAVLKRADYLNGPLATIANAAKIAPKAMKEVLDSGSVRNTDVITGGLASVMEKDPKFLLYPFARQAVRAAMLSQAGQNALIGKIPAAAPINGIPSGLLGQMSPAGALTPSLLTQWNQRP